MAKLSMVLIAMLVVILVQSRLSESRGSKRNPIMEIILKTRNHHIDRIRLSENNNIMHQKSSWKLVKFIEKILGEIQQKYHRKVKHFFIGK